MFSFVLGLIFFHELGHLLTSFYYSRNKDIRLCYYPFKVKVGVEDNLFHLLTSKQKINVYLNGIFLGVMYLMLIVSIIPFKSINMMLVLLYLIGITKDIMGVFELWRGDI